MAIKAVVYVIIILNLIRVDDKVSNTSQLLNSILRLIYIFDFYILFIPVTGGLCLIFKCFGGNKIFVDKTYSFCKISGKTGYLIASIFVLLIKITINILHEICDTEKRIKFSKKWSK